MDALKKEMEQREKAELIAIIKHMLRQEPDLEWLVQTPMPGHSRRKEPVNPAVYKQQILAAMSVGDNQRKRKRHEVQRRLTSIKSIADEFAKYKDYAAALTIYEALITEVVEHFNDYQDEYVAFSVILTSCVDGLDTCFAGEEDNKEIRLRVLQALFTIYRFYTDTGMNLDEDIPGLLVSNSTLEERQIIAGWVRDALSRSKEVKWSAGSTRQKYEKLLLDLAKG
jgi:hypothetical protein